MSNSRSKKGGRKAPLGIIGKFAANGFEKPEFRRLLRFALQRAAADILPAFGVAKCLRRPVKQATHVEIRKRENGRAVFGKLQTCKSLWVCAVCQSRISEGRRFEIKAMLELAERRRYTVGFHTYTLQHDSHMSLQTTLAALKEARRWVSSHRDMKELKASYGYIGAVCATEITWGENGFHPHHHELFFWDHPLSDLAKEAVKQDIETLWHKGLLSQSATGIKEIGFVATYDHKDIASYVSKLGEERLTTWGFAEEVTKANSKTSKGDHYTPNDLLISWLFTENEQHREVWKEYAIATFGAKAIVFTPNLRKHFGIGEVDDAALLLKEEQDASPLYAIELDVWRKILSKDQYGQLRADLLTAAEEGGPAEIAMCLAAYGII